MIMGSCSVDNHGLYVDPRNQPVFIFISISGYYGDDKASINEEESFPLNYNNGNLAIKDTIIAKPRAFQRLQLSLFSILFERNAKFLSQSAFHVKNCLNATSQNFHKVISSLCQPSSCIWIRNNRFMFDFIDPSWRNQSATEDINQTNTTITWLLQLIWSRGCIISYLLWGCHHSLLQVHARLSAID